MDKLSRMRRHFSNDFKKEKVNLIEQGKISVSDICRPYEVSRTAVYQWLYKYGKKYSKNEKDTGSVEVQIALLTEEINSLTDHLKTHIHDFHSKSGLLKKFGQRKSLLTYLMNTDVTRYRNLIKKLNIRK